VYGATDEFHQYFVPNRSAEVQDWLADVLGAVIAAIVINYFLKHRYSLFKKEIPKEA
jgi:VanZ family protein